MTGAKRFAVLGDPIAHSRSPAMHSAAYAALGLPHTYEAIRATPADLPRLIAELRAGAYAGFNVTVPHKANVLAYVDAIDACAEAVHAANTLVVEGDRVIAYNTDVPALADELSAISPERKREDWAARDALVLGSGGAARAALAALASLGVTKATVRARNVGIASEARAALGKAAKEMALTYESLTPHDDDTRFHTIVQATSLGMAGAGDGTLAAHAVAWTRVAVDAVAYDVVYNPPRTPFLIAAHDQNVRTENGLGMLVRQGALAFQRWLGLPPPLTIMRSSLESSSVASV